MKRTAEACEVNCVPAGATAPVGIYDRLSIMEIINSRKNRHIAYIRALGRDRSLRRERSQYFCEGEKLLAEALTWGVTIGAVFYSEQPHVFLPPGIRTYKLNSDLLEYVSPLKNTRGPVFSVNIEEQVVPEECRTAIILDNIQDPGNLGTIIRSANAFSIEAVVLTGNCADPYNPKTVRSSMGALFRQRVLEMNYEDLDRFLVKRGLTLYGAQAEGSAQDVRETSNDRIAVAVGNEGSGLGKEIRDRVKGYLRIPINPDCESLNAAVAASVIMWEIGKRALY